MQKPTFEDGPDAEEAYHDYLTGEPHKDSNAGKYILALLILFLILAALVSWLPWQ